MKNVSLARQIALLPLSTPLMLDKNGKVCYNEKI